MHSPCIAASTHYGTLFLVGTVAATAPTNTFPSLAPSLSPLTGTIAFVLAYAPRQFLSGEDREETKAERRFGFRRPWGKRKVQYYRGGS